jgi:hypothetical protein
MLLADKDVAKAQNASTKMYIMRPIVTRLASRQLVRWRLKLT